ncbi:unnamed protein product [Kuraishia capsulata CBS 1993]|uniref:Enoyl-CoA hydratase n=1 Tax=Kuraishia capsulata CBS 1993 TaxID=1382522 RepID=W6MN43_9ASCO|nr:uncharacterized protein KUCA_T00003647001 [Kuraishia capsulata CBS 1993]CDK27668.1 unnamed protein product [Kuraishia capsulata CBS 1993]
MTFDQYKITKHTGFAHVEFNRPKVLNAFEHETWIQYRKLLLELDKDPEVKVIVISGAGDHLTAGLDLKDAIKGMGSFAGKTQEDLYDHIKDFQDAIGVSTRISTPTIILIHGVCYGLGVDILSTASIRVVSKNSKISIKEIQVGLPADMGSLQRFPRIVGNSSLANRLALTGEDFGWETALRLGLVDEADVVGTKADGLKRCFELASQIAKWEDWCIRGTKLCLSEVSESKTSVQGGLETIAGYNKVNLNPTAFSKSLLKRISKL